MFVWNDGDLNREQIEAIDEAESVFLMACPGSGKTRTLTYKIAHELSRLESDKKWIIAITYTHRAADEILDRIESLGVDTAQLWIGTIHSFCLEWILKPYGIYHSSLRNGFRVVNSHDSELIISELCEEQTKPNVTYWDCEHYYTSTERVLACKAILRPYVNDILDKYSAHLLANHQIDFEQILLFSYELIASQPSISKLLSSLFSYVLVDEYQDTKEIQYAILASILRAGKGTVKTFIVGDPNQSIYGSLGGYAITANELSSIAEITLEEKELSANYRSSSRIIEYFSNYNVFNTTISPQGDLRDFQSNITFDRSTSREDLVDMLARLIRHNIETEGVPPHEVCIIAPWWVHLASMTRNLVAALPEYSFDGPGMVPFARDIDNFWFKLSRIVLTEPSPQMYVRRLRWANEVISALEDANIDVSTLSSKSLLKSCNSIELAEQDGLLYLEQFFEQLFICLEIEFRAIPALFEHHESFFTSSRERIERLQNDGVALAGDITTFRKVFKSRDGITVSTIHGVKGGEYDTVIAYALLEGMVPHFKDSSDESANKLLYVIGSRARKHLHLISETGRMMGRSRREYSPTKVLSRCLFQYDPLP